MRYITDLPCRPIRNGDVIRRDGYNEIEVYSPTDAARAFAHRYARRVYGKRGYCHHVRMELRTENGRWFSYDAFIGVDAEGGGTTGKNIRLTVTVTG